MLHAPVAKKKKKVKRWWGRLQAVNIHYSGHEPIMSNRIPAKKEWLMMPPFSITITQSWCLAPVICSIDQS